MKFAKEYIESVIGGTYETPCCAQPRTILHDVGELDDEEGEGGEVKDQSGSPATYDNRRADIMYRALNNNWNDNQMGVL